MKRLSILVLVALLAGGAFIWATTPTTPIKTTATPGIQFENITFKKALSEAQKEHKLVFMNVYATWCAPCKMLMKNTLSKEDVGKYFNKNFINISIDAEKGEGIDLVKKYQIQGHPLMLVLNHKGEVVKRILGYRTTDQLLNDVKGLTK